MDITNPSLYGLTYIPTCTILEAEEVGRILVDLTFLREQGRIQLTREILPNGVYGKRHYRVAYTMVIKAIGRDLRCELSFFGLSDLTWGISKLTTTI